MNPSPERRRPFLALPAVLVLALVASACGGTKKEDAADTAAAPAASAATSSTAAGGESDTTGAAGAMPAQECGNVVLNENSWVGSSANVYVVKHVLENELDCKVKVTKIAEIPAFQALADGKADAILEDWQHTDEYKKYIEEQGTVTDAGSLGVTGHIGWFTPKYVVDEHPELATWEGLKTKASLFRTAESGDKGMLLDGDPSYVTNDEALVKNLGLDLKVVYAGGEASQITQVRQAYQEKKPILFYWYTPQWLNAELELAEIKLPEWKEGCDADPKKVACAYPDYDLRKLVSTKFAESGSPAFEVIKKFQWTNDQQNEVAVMIAGEKMKPEEAAAKWVEANADTVKEWLPGPAS